MTEPVNISNGLLSPHRQGKAEPHRWNLSSPTHESTSGERSLIDVEKMSLLTESKVAPFQGRTFSWARNDVLSFNLLDSPLSQGAQELMLASPGESFELDNLPDLTLDDRSADESFLGQTSTTFSRALGPAEKSYYFGSLASGDENGINDMYLQLAGNVDRKYMSRERVLMAWTHMVMRHPILLCSIQDQGMGRVNLVYDAVHTLEDAQAAAAKHLRFTDKSMSEVRESFLNGTRTLDENLLSLLTISWEEAGSTAMVPMHVMLNAMHYTGDGWALNTALNEFFELLTADDLSFETVRLDEDENETLARLPRAFEEDVIFEKDGSKLAWAAAQVEYEIKQSKAIGGHVFTRAQGSAPRHTVTVKHTWDAETSKNMTTACKARKVSFNQAVVAMCHESYIKTAGSIDTRLPCMIYSAMNVRSLLESTSSDWFRLAISYYNIVLPSLMPGTLSAAQRFWYRAGLVKSQTCAAVKSASLRTRIKLMSLDRERRSLGFLVNDERQRQGLGPEKRTPVSALNTKEPAPTAAFMGVSLLGDTDAFYPVTKTGKIRLSDIFTGSRQRRGALLLFAYTFAGKLCLCLSYDEANYAPGVIPRWFEALVSSLDTELK